MTSIGVAIDILMMLALGVTIFYGLKLSRKFDMLRADRQAFEQLISALNLASSRAELAIKSMKQAAIESGEGLQQRINAARALADEMEIVVEAGDNLAERLSVLAEKSRKAAVPDAEPAAQPRTSSEGAQPRSRAEKELLEAVKSRQQT